MVIQQYNKVSNLSWSAYGRPYNDLKMHQNTYLRIIPQTNPVQVYWPQRWKAWSVWIPISGRIHLISKHPSTTQTNHPTFLWRLGSWLRVRLWAGTSQCPVLPSNDAIVASRSSEVLSKEPMGTDDATLDHIYIKGLLIPETRALDGSISIFGLAYPSSRVASGIRFSMNVTDFHSKCSLN